MGNAIWLLVMAVMIVIELAVPGLVSIWFALGALAAYVAALIGLGPALQVVVFVLVSLVTLILTRPLAAKYINRKAEKTNKDSVPGRKAIVTETIDNIKASGTVELDGMPWSARSISEEEIIPVGEEVLVDHIEGVKCIVKRENKGENA